MSRDGCRRAAGWLAHAVSCTRAACTRTESTDTQGKRTLRVAAPFLRLHCDLAYALRKTSNETCLFQEIEKMFWVEAPFLGMDGGLRRRGCDGRRCPLLDEGQRGRERFARSDDGGCVRSLRLAFLSLLQNAFRFPEFPPTMFKFVREQHFAFLRCRISNYGVETKWLSGGGVELGVGVVSSWSGSVQLSRTPIIKSEVNSRTRGLKVGGLAG